MKAGDLVLFDGRELCLVLAEPRVSEDCKPGGEGYPNEMYHIVVVLGKYGIEDMLEEDLELISASR